MHKIISRALLALTLAFSVSLASLPVIAQPAAAQLTSTGDCFPGQICTPDPRAVITTVINYFLGFLGLIAVVLIIYAGFLMVTAAGDDGKYKKGFKIVTTAIIGIIVILIAYGIVNFVIQIGQRVS